MKKVILTTILMVSALNVVAEQSVNSEYSKQCYVAMDIAKYTLKSSGEVVSGLSDNPSRENIITMKRLVELNISGYENIKPACKGELTRPELEKFYSLEQGERKSLEKLNILLTVYK